MRFGIATVDISPPFYTPMAGYAARQDNFDRISDPLTFTALILEDRGRRALIGASDLIGFDNEQVMPLRKMLAKIVRAPQDNIMLNSSHTHGGPEMRDKTAYQRDGRDLSAAGRYREWLEGQVKIAAKQALDNLQPGSLWFGLGKTCVPMNRRLLRDGQVVNAPNPDGPKDDRLQVLVLRDKAHAVRAIGIRVSCHPVATGAQHRITADFPGAFRASCQRTFGPDVTPFFLQGAGGDMRPSQVNDGDEWRAMKHEELSVIGDALLRETLAVMTAGNMDKLGPLTLRGKLNVAMLPCERRCTTREQFEELLENGSALEKMYAKQALRHIEVDGHAPSHAPIRVHTLYLTKDMAIVGIQAEVLVGLGAHVEKALAPRRVLLLGYTNGCLSYLPDSKELARGGYEQSSYLYHGWTGPYKRGTEKVIAAAAWKR